MQRDRRPTQHSQSKQPIVQISPSRSALSLARTHGPSARSQHYSMCERFRGWLLSMTRITPREVREYIARWWGLKLRNDRLAQALPNRLSHAVSLHRSATLSADRILYLIQTLTEAIECYRSGYAHAERPLKMPESILQIIAGISRRLLSAPGCEHGQPTVESDPSFSMRCQIALLKAAILSPAYKSISLSKASLEWLIGPEFLLYWRSFQASHGNALTACARTAR